MQVRSGTARGSRNGRSAVRLRASGRRPRPTTRRACPQPAAAGPGHSVEDGCEPSLRLPALRRRRPVLRRSCRPAPGKRRARGHRHDLLRPGLGPGTDGVSAPDARVRRLAGFDRTRGGHGRSRHRGRGLCRTRRSEADPGRTSPTRSSEATKTTSRWLALPGRTIRRRPRRSRQRSIRRSL